MTSGPDTTEYLEPQTWGITQWTPSMAQEALVSASVGHLSLAADLCRSSQQDDRVKNAMGKRSRSLFRNKLTFDGSGDGRKQGRAIKALEAEEDFWLISPEHVLSQLVLWGLLLGVGLAELVWTRSKEHGDRDIPILKIWNPRWLRWDPTLRVWKLTIATGGEITIMPGDGKWFLFLPYGEHEPWSQGLWWPVAFWWLAKQFAVQDWAGHNRMHGAAIPVGKAPAGTTQPDRDAWQKSLERLRRGTAVVLPPGYDLAYLTSPTNSWATFKEKIDLCNRSIDICILGGNLGTEVESGSLAAAEVQERGSDDTTTSDNEVLSTQHRAQVGEWWALFNFGARNLSPWYRWNTEPAEDLEKRAKGLTALGTAITTLNAALASAGLEIDVRQLIAAHNLPTRSRPVPDPAAPDPNAVPAAPGKPGVPAQGAPETP